MNISFIKRHLSVLALTFSTLRDYPLYIKSLFIAIIYFICPYPLILAPIVAAIIIDSRHTTPSKAWFGGVSILFLSALIHGFFAANNVNQSRLQLHLEPLSFGDNAGILASRVFAMMAIFSIVKVFIYYIKVIIDEHF